MVKLSRRNVLIGAGTIVAGGGAALGTGAFSQVEATRDVSVETAGDAGAVVGLEIHSDELRGEDEDTIEFDMEESLNLDAVTRFNGAFEITNNRDETDGGAITVEIDDGDVDLITDNASGESENMYFEHSEGSDGSVEISASDSETFDIVFNLEGVTSTSAGDSALPGSITITANDAS